jgi:large conductance mechanosensitive channel
MSGFRKFLMRGNLIDLAVAVVIGVAFNNIVQALIADIITPIIAAFGGQPDFSHLTFTVHNSLFFYGKFINALLSFFIVAAVIYFLLISPTARLAALAERKREATTRTCPECLSDIPVAARRCMYCTSDVPPVAPARHAAP